MPTVVDCLQPDMPVGVTEYLTADRSEQQRSMWAKNRGGAPLSLCQRCVNADWRSGPVRSAPRGSGRSFTGSDTPGDRVYGLKIGWAQALVGSTSTLGIGSAHGAARPCAPGSDETYGRPDALPSARTRSQRRARRRVGPAPAARPGAACKHPESA